MDDVTTFLQGEGLNPARQGFLGSDYLLGYRVDTPHFTLTYRLDGERLLLCELAAAAADGLAVVSLRKLLLRIVKAVPVVRCVDALILAAPYDPVLNEARARLAKVMLAEGARPVEIEDEQWLRYPCH